MKRERIEILTEEPSMESFLRMILPKILPEGYALDVNCFIRPHEGKSHLQKSIPKKIKAYPHFGEPVRVLIVHDQDSNDCVVLKNQLLKLAQNTYKIPVIVRIACRELENWYLGDLNAVEKAYPHSKASRLSGKSKYRAVDRLTGSEEMKELVKIFTKSDAARRVPGFMDLSNNTSPSFNHFVTGIQKLLAC